METFDIDELADIYQQDCKGNCDQCPLGKAIVEKPIEDPPMPDDFTICTLFDYINLNAHGPKKRQTKRLTTGGKLLKELDELIFPDTSGKYVEFSYPLKEHWLAFRARWERSA